MKSKFDENFKEYTVKRAGLSKTIDASDILVGDIIFVKEGMKIPADCVLIEG